MAIHHYLVTYYCMIEQQPLLPRYWSDVDTRTQRSAARYGISRAQSCRRRRLGELSCRLLGFRWIRRASLGCKSGRKHPDFDSSEQHFPLQGHATAYYGPDLEKYSSFQACNEGITQIFPSEEGGLVVVCNSGIRGIEKQGIPKFALK